MTVTLFVAAGVACLASLASVVAIQIQKSNNYDEHIVRAQELRAELARSR